MVWRIRERMNLGWICRDYSPISCLQVWTDGCLELSAYSYRVRQLSRRLEEGGTIENNVVCPSARCILCYICLYSDRAYSCRPHHSSLISLKLIPSRPVSHSLYRPSSCHEDEEQDDDYKDDNRQHQQSTCSTMFLALYTYIISNWNSSFTHALAVLQVIP